jgi:hypothetical protein
MDFDDKSEIPLFKGKNSLELELVALTEKPFCRIPFRRVTMHADAGSLDLDAVFFLSVETVDSL